MTDEDKIKQMLRSNEGNNRFIGIEYAKQFLNWDNKQIIYFIISDFFIRNNNTKKRARLDFKYEDIDFSIEIEFEGKEYNVYKFVCDITKFNDESIYKKSRKSAIFHKYFGITLTYIRLKNNIFL